MVVAAEMKNLWNLITICKIPNKFQITISKSVACDS